MNRIQKISTTFLRIFLFLFIFLPVMNLFKWAFMSADFMNSSMGHMTIMQTYNAPEGMINLGEVQWTFLTRGIAFCSSLIELLPVMIGLYALIKIFQKYRLGEIFNAENARYYRLIGFMFFMDALIAKPIGECLMTLALTLNSPPGQRYIGLSFGSTNIEALFVGAVVIVVSWVMLEASKLHDEQRLTV
jgi:hypothetical protein